MVQLYRGRLLRSSKAAWGTFETGTPQTPNDANGPSKRPKETAARPQLPRIGLSPLCPPEGEPRDFCAIPPDWEPLAGHRLLFFVQEDELSGPSPILICLFSGGKSDPARLGTTKKIFDQDGYPVARIAPLGRGPSEQLRASDGGGLLQPPTAPA